MRRHLAKWLLVAALLAVAGVAVADATSVAGQLPVASRQTPDAVSKPVPAASSVRLSLAPSAKAGVDDPVLLDGGRGSAVAAWSQVLSPTVARVAARDFSASGSWSGTTYISSASQYASNLTGAAAGNGAVALAWVEGPPLESVVNGEEFFNYNQAAVLTVAVSLGPGRPWHLQQLSTDAQLGTEPQVAVSASGEATVVWVEPLASVSGDGAAASADKRQAILESTYAPAPKSAAGWRASAPKVIATAPAAGVEVPALTGSSRGAAAVSWYVPTGGSLASQITGDIYVVTRAGTGSRWSAARKLGAHVVVPVYDLEIPSPFLKGVAVSSSGDAIVAWEEPGSGGGVEYARLSHGRWHEAKLAGTADTPKGDSEGLIGVDAEQARHATILVGQVLRKGVLTQARTVDLATGSVGGQVTVAPAKARFYDAWDFTVAGNGAQAVSWQSGVKLGFAILSAGRWHDQVIAHPDGNADQTEALSMKYGALVSWVATNKNDETSLQARFIPESSS